MPRKTITYVGPWVGRGGPLCASMMLANGAFVAVFAVLAVPSIRRRGFLVRSFIWEDGSYLSF